MKRALILVFLIFFSSTVCASSLESPVAERVYSGTQEIEMSGMIGGIAIDIGAGNISNSTGQIESSSWPNIVEVYTATWCANCIDSEHVVDVLSQSTQVERLHYHREYSESQDPFGTEVGDDRWIERYGPTSVISTDGLERTPPSIVFNGEWMHTGTQTKGGVSLADDYTQSLSMGSSLPLDGLSSSLEWVASSSNNSEGTVSWTIGPNLESKHVDDYWEKCAMFPGATEYTPVLFVVENVARYEQGTNGLENYSHVIRDIHRLESSFTNDNSNGSASVTLPTIWDGADFRLVMAFEWSTIFAMEADASCGDEGGFLPSVGLFSITLVFLVASLFYRRK